MADLDSSTSSFSVGQAINDKGDVVGWVNAGFDIDHAFLYLENVSQALLLDPVLAVPEPRTPAMLLTGLGLMGWTLRRKHWMQCQATQ